MFAKVLIANRGEIACRIIATCRRLGVRAVAVYSAADAGARHVRRADEARYLGPAASTESYLASERIIAAAKAAGAEAIHPGYGFLSENAAFAAACEHAGLVFIGPPAAAIEAMGAKSAAKTLMADAGVPLVPGYHGSDQASARLQQAAEDIGYPVMIKASAGGGGKGMRVVASADAFAEALASCQRESAASFGDDRVLIEKYIERPRHIEIQVFADAAGHTVSLYERDCSCQRRHQKVVEEAPAPGLSAEQRAAMGGAACDAAKAVGYVGAGTVEFIVDADGGFFFMEMNTRLQVEHAVTEKITGLDLVEWQLRVAGGEDLPLAQHAIPLTGHAIEARLYAEQPAREFLPSVGELAHFVAPADSAHVRLDTGVDAGDEISSHYDPMIAKLIVWDDDRERAITRIRTALAATQVVGVENNSAFLARLVGHPAFRAGRADTGLIERELDALTATEREPPADVFAIAALAHIEAETAAGDDSPWAIADGWRLNGVQSRQLVLCAHGEDRSVEITYTRDGLTVDGESAAIAAGHGRDRRVTIGDRQHSATVVAHDQTYHVFFADAHYRLAAREPLAEAVAGDDPKGELTAPMPGRVVRIAHAAGDKVDKGAVLLVMEAMKMELTLRAPTAGTVVAYPYAEGDQVVEGVELVEFDAAG